MAVYFQFNRKTDGTVVPPAKADDEIREFFKAEPDSVNWFNHWYSRIGIGLACGKGFAELRGDWDDVEGMSEIINFIEDTYDVTNGYCR